MKNWVDNTLTQLRNQTVSFGDEYKPEYIIDVATLTGAIDVALGYQYTGVFTNDDGLWEALKEAGNKAHDRFWRMPLDSEYIKDMKSNVADLKNVGVR
jgi:aminopeptidase